MFRNNKIGLIAIAGALLFLAGIFILMSGNGRVTGFAVENSQQEGFSEKTLRSFIEVFTGNRDASDNSGDEVNKKEIPKFDYTKFEGGEDLFDRGQGDSFLNEQDTLQGNGFRLEGDMIVPDENFNEEGLIDNFGVGGLTGQEGPEFGPGVIVVLPEEPVATVTAKPEFKVIYDAKKEEVTNTFTRSGEKPTVQDYKDIYKDERLKTMFRQQKDLVVAEQDLFLEKLEEVKGNTINLREFDKNQLAGNTIYLEDFDYNNPDDLELIRRATEEAGINREDVRIEPNRKSELLLDTSVPWIEAPQVWGLVDDFGLPIDGTGMVISVIDTGIDYTHPDLGGCTLEQITAGECDKVLGGYDLVLDREDFMDFNLHGTHVAATAAGIGDVYRGVAPGAKIYAYNVCAFGCYESFIVQAIDLSIDPNGDGDYSDHVDVITMSIGGYGSVHDVMAQAFDRASSLDIISSIAAGNSGPFSETILCPACAESVVAVAAACQPHQVGINGHCGGNIAGFSSRGPYIEDGVNYQKPDISAPGVSICAARLGSLGRNDLDCGDDQHLAISGTSMATPHVGGALLLIRQAHPELNPEEIKYLIKTTTSDLGSEYDAQGAGLINVIGAVRDESFRDLYVHPRYLYASTEQPVSRFQNVVLEPSLINTREDSSFLVQQPSLIGFDGFPIQEGIFFESNINSDGIYLEPDSSFQLFLNFTFDLDYIGDGSFQYFKLLFNTVNSSGDVNYFFVPVAVSIGSSVSVYPLNQNFFFENEYEEPVVYFNGSLNISNSRTDVSKLFNISIFSNNCGNEGFSYIYPDIVEVSEGGTTIVPINFSFYNPSLFSNGYSCGLSLRIKEFVSATVERQKEDFVSFSFYNYPMVIINASEFPATSHIRSK